MRAAIELLKYEINKKNIEIGLKNLNGSSTKLYEEIRDQYEKAVDNLTSSSLIISESDEGANGVCKYHQFRDVSNNINNPPIFKCDNCGMFADGR